MAEYFRTLSFDYATFLFLNLILSSVVILLERKNPTEALAWLFFLNLLPGFGFFFYILLSQNISKRKIFRYTQEESNFYTKVLNEQWNNIKDGYFLFHKPEVEKHKDMILFHNNLSDSLFTQNNSVEIFTTGVDKFDRLFKDIEKATQHIHIIYFIIKNDAVSNQLIDLLAKKAKEGVEVKLLVDHFGGRKLRKSHQKKLEEAGALMEFFFPSRLKYFNLKGNYRNHRKLVIIDGSIGYIGGFNVGDEYLGKDPYFGFWRDTHLRIVGDSVISMQIRFILDWRNASKHEIQATGSYLSSVSTNSETAIQIVSSGPDNINQQIKQGYLQLIHSARKYIYIQTPYFIPDESIIEGLKIAAASGVDVRIMIPNKPDHLFVYWATYAFCGDLLPYGVRIYTYENGFLHTKAILIDDELSSVGTCNFDLRSFKLNFEVNAFIYDAETTIKLRNEFFYDLKVSQELTLELYKARSFYTKLREAISRLFSAVL